MLAGVYEGSALGGFKRLIEGATRPQLGGLLFSLCLLPGLCEELFFRGLVQTRLAQRWRPITAVVVTSACFGLWHLDPFQSTEAFFLGLGLGYVAVRTGSIWPGIVAHVVNNAANVLFQALGLVSAALLPNLAWGAVGLVLFVLCLMAFRRRPPVPAAEPVAVSAVQ
jgi:membrane protease YdiL (CAAX protease family)